MKKILLILLLISLGTLYSSCFIVNEMEYAIVTQFGKPIKVIEDSGFYMRAPFFFNKVNRIDKRMMSFKTQPIQLLLGDQNPIILTCFVCYKIQKPLLFFESLIYEEVAIQKLSDMVVSSLGSTLSDYKIDNIININAESVKLAEIENRILEHANKKSVEKYGIKIDRVGIRRINYPAIVANSVYERMKAEREKEAKKYRAEGKEEAAKIYAETNKMATKIKSEAYKKSEIIKGEADKESIQIYANAYSKDPELFQFLKSMDTIKDVFNSQRTLILSTESELFKYLNLNPNTKEK